MHHQVNGTEPWPQVSKWVALLTATLLFAFTILNNYQCLLQQSFSFLHSNYSIVQFSSSLSCNFFLSLSLYSFSFLFHFLYRVFVFFNCLYLSAHLLIFALTYFFILYNLYSLQLAVYRNIFACLPNFLFFLIESLVYYLRTTIVTSYCLNYHHNYITHIITITAS